MTAAEFRLAVKHRLLDLDMTQDEMIERVREKTGMYLDRSYLHKLFTGSRRSKKIFQAIREVLDLPEA